MKNFSLKQSNLEDVTIQNDIVTIEARYVIKFYDYIIDKATGKVVRGTKHDKMKVTYLMKFRKSINEIQQVTKCPNCGAEVKYRIEFKDGKIICEKGYNWFLGNLSNPKIIQSIEIEFRMNYSRKTENEKKYHDEFTNLNADIRFSDYTKYNRYSDATINIRSTMHEDEAYDMYSVVKEILERNEDRFNNTIKNRKVRIQSFCISVGLIATYIIKNEYR